IPGVKGATVPPPLPSARLSPASSDRAPPVSCSDCCRITKKFPFSILHSCARDGRSTLTLALFHPQFGESSSVSLGNPTSIAHLDHLEEDQGRILIASCDLRRLLREFTLNHARLRRLDDLLLDSNHRLSATGHRQQKAKKISSLDPLSMNTKIPFPSLTMFLPAGPVP
uniref:Uncharacterized protein n=1 Tax=Pristionchus pacificus TaxID=54126 RepID=A0A8R1USK5_PRIPA